MRDLTRRQLLIIAAAVLVLATTAVGTYGLITGPSSPPTRSLATVHVTAHPTASEPATADSPSPAALPHTKDPITYARAVATSLFDWDTAAGYLPTDYAAPALSDSDPSGEETAGLVNDVATYLPTTEQWLDLAAMDVAQSIVIDDVSVPASWASALAQSHGQLRPGTTAVTITGTRHRSGVWDGEPASSSSPVSFTVFVACRPAFGRCHLLRLSQLDNPLR